MALWDRRTTRTPRLAVADGVVYVGSDDNFLYALKANTGELLWRYETGGNVDSAPVVMAGVVYVSTNDGYLYALDTDSSSTTEPPVAPAVSSPAPSTPAPAQTEPRPTPIPSPMPTSQPKPQPTAIPRPEPTPTLTEERRKGFHCLSDWDGHNEWLEREIKRGDYLTDPDSFKARETRIGVLTNGEHYITMRFTHKNAFGGTVTHTAKAFVDHETCQVTRVVDIE